MPPRDQRVERVAFSELTAYDDQFVERVGVCRVVGVTHGLPSLALLQESGEVPKGSSSGAVVVASGLAEGQQIGHAPIEVRVPQQPSPATGRRETLEAIECSLVATCRPWPCPRSAI